ncbi:putative L-xylulose 5-phosphate 3-epimerase [Limihaloglobus sulfuriphilus]|uniref:Putative L-xylulose 5-phosphate 3-epimerase n=1 Tax=Limihaloglobus sulfuriphilus TaxID=1851148 RepID=A0A1Q2MBV8_9BACT|nr:sugar phosphate isomerase/epimerase family protein [Limihaloglobus sulfuriphilus]AQQ70018.1 putative L-xylulose 5-phosphate 3-epimerase [Limihaloglobus sulfuriphilus]
MNNTKMNIGVCNWSLQMDISGAASFMKEAGINHVHLAVGPALGDDGSSYLSAAKKQDWKISSTMINFPQEDYSTLDTIKETGGITPDGCWDVNKDRFIRAAEITKDLNVSYISMHAGFIDHNDSAKYRVMCNRVTELADIAADNGTILLLETGQETAQELKDFMDEIKHPSTGVNIDPANMILYAKGDPVEGVKILDQWIRHVHIKDAVRAKTPGQWGTEVPWGQGQVETVEFLKALSAIGYEGTLAVEREGGEDRCGDVKLAVNRLKQYL